MRRDIAMSRNHAGILGLAASGAMVVGLLAPFPVASATTTPAGNVAESATAGTAVSTGNARLGPWNDPHYKPRPGQWQDYVLAPASRTVRAQSVLSSLPRGGSITGDPAHALSKDGKTVRLTSTGDRTQSPLLILDFGKEVAGKPELQISSASDPRPALHTCFAESKKYMALSPSQNNGEAAHAPGCDTANIWNGFPGTAYTYDSDSHTLPLKSAKLPGAVSDDQIRGGFRYLTVFLDGPGSIDLDAVTVHYTAAPAQQDLRNYPGHFLSSDNLLNKVWYAGAYTTQLNTGASDTAKSWPYQNGEADHADAQVPGADPGKEVIYDGGKRDRIVWQGDLAVQAPVTYLSTHDLDAVDNSLSSLAGQQLADGFMPAESQVGQHNRDELRTYGEYVTWFVYNMYEHYLYTGDQAYLDRWYPAMTRAMTWLESVRQQDAKGLIGFGAVGSCGHYGYSDCGHETYVNALYVRNLREMAELAAAEKHDAAASTYDQRADTVAQAINDQLWDQDTGAYRLSREIPNAYPQDANATAVLTGVADDAQAKRAMTYLHANSWGKLGALTVSPSTPNSSLSPFYAPLPSAFEADARLSQVDPTQVRQQSGVDLIRKFWGWMLDQDPGSTFWEHVQPDGTPNLAQFSSLAHGWASGPTITLTNRVLGVAPTGPGYATYAVAPHPDSLSWAEGVVPTPHGKIDTSWRHTNDGSFRLSLSAPAGTNGQLRVPTFGDTVDVTLDGDTVWSGDHGSAHLQDGHVVIDDVAPGHHVVRSTPQADAPATATVTVRPATIATAPDSIEHLSVTVSGTAPQRLTGTLSTTGPDGWVISPTPIQVDLKSFGRPVSKSYDVYVYVPSSVTSGSYQVKAAFDGSGTTSSDASTLRLTKDVSLYDFEDGLQGWQAGKNVASVARVGGFANGPGKPFAGQGALEATADAVPGDAMKTVTVSPQSPVDLTDAKQLVAHIDSYGGAPGATGYEAVVTLTGAGGDQLTKSFPMSPDAWTALNLDVSGWAARSAVSRIEVGFHALGTSSPWSPRFQGRRRRLERMSRPVPTGR